MKNKNMTTLYQPPELEIIAFEIDDVITTSGPADSNNPYVPDDNVDDDW